MEIVAVIAMCVLRNALDGFNVLSISFASPWVAKEWNYASTGIGAGAVSPEPAR